MKDDRDPTTGKLNWGPGEQAAFRAKQKAKKMAARAERDARAAREKADREALLSKRYAAPPAEVRPPERAWVQTALKSRGRTLTDLAHAWGVSPPTITKWLDGSVSMTALTLERAVSLADMLGIDLTDLAQRLGFNPTESEPPSPSLRTPSPGGPVFAVTRVGAGYQIRVDAVVTGAAGAALARAVLAAADEGISWDDK
ncbi:helix-turn-helix domain-containing protein [Falsiroseomonas oryziterrae]|uniref:helix-turn-helix domain-containing protein n=1 Tax=Falsiroseomonas oryziterrae TaxID=2911368 RepID=UPI001F161EB9|nr:helix-turn-helix transcriptional regulator [Roseomonas sp. NPKOSM-4]